MSLDRRAAFIAVLCICLSKYECMNMLRAVSICSSGGTNPVDVECDNTVPFWKNVLTHSVTAVMGQPGVTAYQSTRVQEH